ncbi:MAG TPA: methyltransferase domain-containing protein [Rhizomicrobium sp.]|jgi:SAM-dependent methyltransferase
MPDSAIGLNLSADPFWQRPGWTTSDHKKHWWGRPDTAWRLASLDAAFEYVFTSHMLEHIPHFKIDAVLKECNRVLKMGGVIRLVCPNLEVFAKAYVGRDADMFAKICDEDPTTRQDLGFGGKLIFSWQKLKSLPRQFRLGAVRSAARRGTALNRLAHMVPDSMHLSDKRWAGIR